MFSSKQDSALQETLFAQAQAQNRSSFAKKGKQLLLYVIVNSCASDCIFNYHFVTMLSLGGNKPPVVIHQTVDGSAVLQQADEVIIAYSFLNI